MRIRNSEGYNDTAKREVICKSLQNMSIQELNNNLSLFTMEARKVNGNKYPPYKYAPRYYSYYSTPYETGRAQILGVSLMMPNLHNSGQV